MEKQSIMKGVVLLDDVKTIIEIFFLLVIIGGFLMITGISVTDLVGYAGSNLYEIIKAMVNSILNGLSSLFWSRI